MTKTPTTTRPRRNRALVVIDIIAGILFGLLGLYYVFYLTVFVTFAAPHQAFDLPYRALIFLSWLAGVVVFIIFAVRRRVAFYWTIVGIALMLIVGNVIVAIAGATA